MDGSQIRKAREQIKLGQIPFALLAGIARSGLQNLEMTGNGTIATLERVIASLPNLHAITLGGREFVAVDRLAAQRAVMRLLDDARELAAILAGDPAPSVATAPEPAGATRFESSGVDDAARARVAAVEDAVARGHLTPEEDP